MAETPRNPDTPAPHIAEAQSPDKLAANMLRALEAGAQAMVKYAEHRDKRDGAFSMAESFADSAKLFGPIASFWLNDPARLADAQNKLGQDLIELWGRTYRRFMGETVLPLAKPVSGDMRFQDVDWTDNPFFDFLKQAYLITGKWAEDMIESADTVDRHTRHRAEFYLNQMVSALSPSNFPFTNPEVIRTTFSSNGENLARGMNQLLADWDTSGELLNIRQTDMSAFKVGKNLATTPGKVVYQNDLLQLIQYAPSTPSVFEIPLLIVPPWINKFYILDLNPQKSFIKWLVERGLTVFVVSWVNPDARLAAKSFEDYMREGIFETVDAVMRATGAPKVNALGYCVGGTLLASALAYMAALNDTRVGSASFLAAQTDFAKAGDLLVFIDDEQLKALDDVMAEKGFLDGARMATVFNMLRPRDLIWPYIVNNYLLGKQPFPFDLLYWNADSTRMPPANHSYYLREFYRFNKLAQGLLTIGGVKLDLRKITIPVYELATRDDHIAPAQSVFDGAKLFGGAVRFVLAGSGHIAGVINPPDKPKYMHWVLDGAEANALALPSIDAFVESARQVTGSWWPDYAAWLLPHSGDRVSPRVPGTGSLPAIEDAPGSYVKV